MDYRNKVLTYLNFAASHDGPNTEAEWQTATELYLKENNLSINYLLEEDGALVDTIHK